MAEAKRVAVITGAGSGIGAALARRFSAEGFAVVLAGRRPEALAAVARDCGADAALAVPTDVSRHEALEALVTRAVERFGGIDVLVNNAGVAYGGTLEDMEPGEIDYAVRVNLVAPLWLTRLAMPWLRKSATPRIVNIASLSGLLVLPHQSVYAATKAGLAAAGLATSRELRKTAIRVCTVLAGSVATETLSPELIAKAKSLKVPVHPMTAERAASIIVPAALRGRRTIYVTSAAERAAVVMQRWMPWLLDRVYTNIGDDFHEVAMLGTRYLRERHPAARQRPE